MNNFNPSAPDTDPHQKKPQKTLFESISAILFRSREWREFRDYTNPAAFYAGVLWAGIGSILMFRLLRAGRKSFRNADDLTNNEFEKRIRIKGIVVKVGDGDGFRLKHMNWVEQLSWLISGSRNAESFVKVPPCPEEFIHLKNRDDVTRRPIPTIGSISSETISVRVAGVDAPECAHFGKKGQMYGPIVRQWLQHAALGKFVSVDVLLREQYGRALAYPWLHSFQLDPFPTNLPLFMARNGMASVFTGVNAEYGDFEEELWEAQEAAESEKLGQFNDPEYESPMAFKKAHAD